MSRRSQRALPPSSLPVMKQNGHVEPRWYRFFEDINKVLGGDGTIQIQPDALPNAVVSQLEAVSGQSLTASDQGGGTGAQIAIDEGIRTLGSRQIVLQAGTIVDLAYDTDYIVYFRDPDRAGGVVGFKATTVANDALSDPANVIVGGIRTPASGEPPNTEAPSAPSYQRGLKSGNEVP